MKVGDRFFPEFVLLDAQLEQQRVRQTLIHGYVRFSWPLTSASKFRMQTVIRERQGKENPPAVLNTLHTYLRVSDFVKASVFSRNRLFCSYMDQLFSLSKIVHFQIVNDILMKMKLHLTIKVYFHENIFCRSMDQLFALSRSVNFGIVSDMLMK